MFVVAKVLKLQERYLLGYGGEEAGEALSAQAVTVSGLELMGKGAAFRGHGLGFRVQGLVSCKV